MHIYRHFLSSFFIFILIVAMADFALASSIGNVSSPVVNEGEYEVEWRVGFSQDDDTPRGDDRLQMRQHFQYGFTDDYAMRLILVEDKRKGEDTNYTGFTIENHFQLMDQKTHGFDAGVRLNYTRADGDDGADNVTAAGLVQWDFASDWQWRHNVSLSHELGAEHVSGVNVGYRTEVTKQVAPHMRAGLELFYDIGNVREQAGYDAQDVSFGPIVKGNLGNGFYYQTGYRAGLSQNADDHSFKLFLGKTF